MRVTDEEKLICDIHYLNSIDFFASLILLIDYWTFSFPHIKIGKNEFLMKIISRNDRISVGYLQCKYL